MKPYLTLLLFFFCTALFAQQLEDDEARFFAQALYDNDVLSDAGFAKLNLLIRNQQLGKYSSRLSGTDILQSRPISPSSLIGFLNSVYHDEYGFRTAKAEVGDLAQFFFGDVPPRTLSVAQENALLAEARKRFGNMKGPMIEKALGQDVFVDNALPDFFMQFARPLPTEGMMGMKNDRPEYISLLSPNRSVFGKDILAVIDILEELGLSLPSDREGLEIDSLEAHPYVAHYFIDGVGRSVVNREMAPEHRDANIVYIEKALELGLLSHSTSEKLKADKAIMEQSSKLPFINAFERGVEEFALGFRPNHKDGLREFSRGLRQLSPDFANIEMAYKFTINKRKPSSRYADGNDLTLTLTDRDKTQSITYRKGKPYPNESEPFFSVDRELIGLVNKHLSEIDHPKSLFSMWSPSLDSAKDQSRGNRTLLLLTDEEASALIERTMIDITNGPSRYLPLRY